MRLSHPPTTRTLLTTLFLGWLVAVPHLHAAPLDVVLLFDASASVARLDPQDQRQRLAQSLIDQLDRHDRAAVIAFAEDIYPLTPLLRAGGRGNRARLKTAVRQIPTDGFYTDLSGALDEAAARLWGNPERAKAIVLLSDGRIALANEDRIARHTQYILFDLLPRLTKRKVRLFTVAPPQGGNPSLLRLLAEDGRGLHLTLENGRSPDALARRILALAHRGGIPPREKHPLQITPGVQRAILVARIKGDPHIRLTDPEGKSRKTPSERSGDLIYLRLDRPQPGTWTLSHRKGRLKDLRLYQDPTANLRLQSGEQTVGGQLLFNAWVQDHNGSDPFLQGLPLRLTVTGPDGTAMELPLNDQGQLGDAVAKDGIYTTLFTPTLPGTYNLDLEAHLGPYPLTSHHSLDIQPPPPADPAPHPAAEVGHPSAAPEHGADLPPSEGADSPPEADKPPPEEEQGNSMIFWISLIWLLLVLAGGAGGLWWWLKKKKSGKTPAKDGDAEAVEIDEED